MQIKSVKVLNKKFYKLISLGIAYIKNSVIFAISKLNNQSVMTQFEQAQQDVKDGKIKTPSVSMGSKEIDYFGYQISVHLYQLKILARGMTMRGVKFTPIKAYYGLKGRSAKDCLPELQKISDDYKETLK